MLREYWDQPAKTADSIRDGWFYSRDRYRRDPEDRYWYEGRADDMFKVSGLWVAPADVEARLIEHPARSRSRGRRRAAGGLHEGEGMRGGHEPSRRARSSRTSCAGSARPSSIATRFPQVIEFVDGLPKTATGKIERYKLRESA